ncbi:MAG TPA: hypothetical protein VFQ76_04645 [Longimicrobiaceae bacterium]|nr:hypothetical protein [Longimicrobiaceae bacterium]
MRTPRFVLAALVCVLLAGCAGDDLTSPAAALGSIDPEVQCPDPDQCGGGGYVPPAPAEYHGSDTDISRSWQQYGPSSWAWASIHKGNSWSVVNSSVYASGRVDAVAYTFAGCRSGSRAEFGRDSRTVYGPGTAEVYFRFTTFGKFGFQVKGTHTFVGSPGSGIGTHVFYSEASHCDDSIF